MPIASLLSALEERTIARQVGLAHDETRMLYALRANTVADFDHFSDVIGDYYAYHHAQCVSPGGHMSRTEAAGRAKEIIEQEYKRRGGDVVMAFNDAHDGTSGGLRAVLDVIAERLKTESVERYVRDVFDRHVAPNNWDQKVQIIREFIAQCGAYLAPSIRTDQVERYARDYRELIHGYTEQLRRTSAMFRRL